MLSFKKGMVVLVALAVLFSMSGIGFAQDLSLEFQQWWGVELPEGELRDIADGYTAETGIEIELLSNPYADTRDQISAGAATGTMADVVGLDGSWVYDFAVQGSIANLSALMEADGYDDSQLSDQIRVEGNTYMIPVANFAYPMFVNMDILEEAGITELPKTRSEFIEAAEAVTENTSAYGWIIPLSTSSPSGIQNNFMGWLWASGGSMLEDGRPNLVGNERRVLVSELAGKSNLRYKLKEIGFDLNDFSDQMIKKLIKKVKALENQGYQFEGAEASLILLAFREFKDYSSFFEIEDFRTNSVNRENETYSEAVVKMKVNGKKVHIAADGDGPVNALDNCFRKALVSFYPEITETKLIDYKVRVLNGNDGTAAKVRVLIETADLEKSWTTVGVSTNIIQASWDALLDSIEYWLLVEAGVSIK